MKRMAPPMSTSTSSSSMNRRCSSAKATIAFIARYSTAARGPIDEQRAAGHDLLAEGQAFEYLDLAVALATGADAAQRDVVCGQHDPDARGVAFIDHRLARYRRGVDIG